MAITTAEQVIVGTQSVSLPQAHGQISLFTLPQSFVWLKHFSAEEIAEFFTELFEALNQSQQNGDWSLVVEVIESWQETANIKADPIVTDGVQQGLAELAAGQEVSWTTLRAELGL